MNRSDVIRLLEEYKKGITTEVPMISTEYKIWSRKINYMERSLEKYVNVWIRILSSGYCGDPFSTAVFINLHNAFQETDFFGFLGCPVLKHVISNQLLIYRDLTDVREGVNYGLMDVGRVILMQDWTFLKVLILYGIIQEKATLTWSTKAHHGHFLCSFLNDIMLPTEENRFNGHANNILSRLDPRTFDSVDAEGKQKILRKYKVLKSLACKDYVWGRNPSDTVFKCLNYYFQVILDPFVTAREIKDLIEINEQTQSMFNTSRFRSFMLEYSRLFPESGVLQPRSLQHLSRCAAREHLCKYGLLPNVVSRLMIPKAIKEYLLVVNPES